MAAKKRKDAKGKVLRTGEYQRKDGSYEYKYTDRFKKRHSIYAKTLELLRVKEQDVLYQRITNQNYHNSVTVDDVFRSWILSKFDIKETTKNLYIDYYQKYIFSVFGKDYINKIKRSDIKLFYKYLFTEKLLKENTIRIVHAILCQIFEFAYDDEYISSNPCKNATNQFRSIKKPTKKKALTIEEQKTFEKILNQEEFKMYSNLFTTMLWSGMRVGEVIGLRWQNVDFKNNQICITNTLVKVRKEGKIVRKLNTPKTQNSKRKIPMLDLVKNSLSQEKILQEKKNISCKEKIAKENDFVFLTPRGKLFHISTLNEVLARIVNFSRQENDCVPLPNISCHILRHTFATRLCEAGLNFKVIQSVLGHSDIKMTMDIYVDVSDEMKRNVFDEFERYNSKTL